MRRYKIVYSHNGNEGVEEIVAFSKYNAKIRFYLAHPCDEIISIEEVTAQ